MDYEKYVQELIQWAIDRGFTINKTYDKKTGCIDLEKGDYVIEVEINYYQTPFNIGFYDYSTATYNDGTNGLLGWFFMKHLCSFNKPISKELFNELCNYYDL